MVLRGRQSQESVVDLLGLLADEVLSWGELASAGDRWYRSDPTGGTRAACRMNTHQSRNRDRLWQGREGKMVETHVCLREACPFQPFYRS